MAREALDSDQHRQPGPIQMLQGRIMSSESLEFTGNYGLGIFKSRTQISWHGPPACAFGFPVTDDQHPKDFH